MIRRASDPAIVLLKEELARLLKLLDKVEDPSNGRFAARADIWLSTEEVVVRFEVPGADPKSISLTGHPTFLEISGTRLSYAPPAGGRYLIAERVVGPFRRAVELPVAVDLSHADASFAGGVVTVVLRRINDRRGQRRRIELDLDVKGR